MAAMITAGTKYDDTRSASRWIGARDLCASLTIFTICDNNVSEPTRSARIMNPPVPLTVPAVTFASLSFSTGMGSPLIIDSSTELWPSSTVPSTGTFSPGRTRSLSPTCTCSSGTSASPPLSSSRLAVVVTEVGRFRGKAEQRTNRAAGLAASAELHHLSKKDKRNNPRCRLEVHIDLPSGSTKRSWKYLGNDGSEHAVKIGGAGTKGNQGEHVQAAMHYRLPAPDEERQPAPEDDWGRQRELDPRPHSR